MSNALLSDVQARAEARRTQTRDQQWQELVQAAWRRSIDANAAGNVSEALSWLHRAHRMLPKDGTVAFALASSLMQAGDLAQAATLFQDLGDRFSLPEALSGLAACARLLGDHNRAAVAIAAALQAIVPTVTLRALAAAVAPVGGFPGWCGLDGDGVVHVGTAHDVEVSLDALPIQLKWRNGRGQLPPGWRKARVLRVQCNDAPCLGSPIDVARITQIEGVVEARDGGLHGWAWHPADPTRDPVLTLQGLSITATEAADDIALDRPLARPRRFTVAAAVINQDHALSVRAPDGRHLLGSPLDPGLEWRTAATLARAVQHPQSAPAHATILADTVRPRASRPTTRPGPVDVVIPVYRGRSQTLACLNSVLASMPRGTRVWVIEDASPEPDLVAALQALARQKRIRLIRQPENRGFPATANVGLRACAPRDAVLLNSDTLVPPGWLDRLRAAAYSAPDIGTVTPLSNDATIVSYPDPAGGNAIPDLATCVATDVLAQRANGDAVIDIPTGVGFCLYLRRDCLDEAGLFREDSFAQGYGEENDLCLRAQHLGWRSVALPGLFVAHVGGQSFGSGRRHLLQRNVVVLNRLHPGYDALIAAHIAADPLAPARRRIDALRWAAGRTRTGAAILVTHAGGGGVDRVVAERCAVLAAAGLRPIVLRPAASGLRNACHVGGDAYPNLAYAVPQDLRELARLLRPDRPRHLELHHLLGHDHAVVELARLLRLPMDVHVHDYASFCPRIALVSVGRRYCGEPDVAGCKACVADLGSNLHEDIPVAALLARSTLDMASARQVIVPTLDAAARIRRHFPGTKPVVQPWENDAALAPLAPMRSGAPRRVCVVGAIGVEKGYEVLLACARDARARSLSLEFVVVGYTVDDTRLMDAGPVFVTGEYAEADAAALIRAQMAHLAFIPSVWPETWCFALSRAWEAGLAVVAFNLGAQAERIGATGRGWLLPLGLQARAVNDALLSLQHSPVSAHSLRYSIAERLAPEYAPSHSL